jgi:hypothetical protein
MFATTTLLISGTMLALALTALPAAAEDDPQGADCFFAENRDDPLCRETTVAGIALLQQPVAPRRYAPMQDDVESVDCFFAENREHPLCREVP